ATQSAARWHYKSLIFQKFFFEKEFKKALAKVEEVAIMRATSTLTASGERSWESVELQRFQA
ncbi:hypothetical protein, partial [Microbulbifer mangrovi]|uniref:hypothetical protein n=1 Tax=Microbulbifer mangrovi TaxID=927787 RepID=UPI0013018A0F